VAANDFNEVEDAAKLGEVALLSQRHRIAKAVERGFEFASLNLSLRLLELVGHAAPFSGPRSVTWPSHIGNRPEVSHDATASIRRQQQVAD
jgi:hypothetical protein